MSPLLIRPLNSAPQSLLNLLISSDRSAAYLRASSITFCQLVFLSIWAGVALNAPCRASPLPDVRFSLSPDSGSLSASISNAPLATALAELGKVMPLQVHFSGEGANDIVSASFTDLPPDEAIRRIVGDNYLLEFAGAGSRGEKYAPPLQGLTVIRILARSHGAVSSRTSQSAGPVDKQAPTLSEAEKAGIAELSRNAIESNTPDERIQALLTLAGYAGSVQKGLIAPTFEKALADPEAEVRKAAFRGISENSMAISDASLIDVAGADEEPEIRLQSLYEIVNRTNPAVARAFLEKAQQDPDTQVSQTAQELLRGIN